MGELKTYKARSTGIIVLLLLLFSGVNNKKCKQDTVAPHKDIPIAQPQTQQHTASQSSNSPQLATTSTVTQTSDTAKSSSHTYFPPPSRTIAPALVIPAKGQAAGSQVAISDPSTVHQAKKSPYQSLAAEHPVFSKDSLRRIFSGRNSPKVTLPQPDSEIAQLEVQYEERKFAPLPTRESDKAGQPVRNDKINLADKTGSNYFNASVGSNINDEMNSVFTARLLYDSVVATSNKDFVYNTLTLTNTSNSRISIQVVIYSPESWQMITSHIVDITLEPLANSIVPMRFTPTGNNTAQWQEVRIEYRMNNVNDSRKTTFRLKVQEYSGFKASLPNSTKVLTSYQRNNSFPVVIRNTGNTPAVYQVVAANQLLKLEVNYEIPMTGGKDTTFYLPFTLSESQYAMLKKEEVRVAVSNEKKETINLIQSISKVGNILKDHPSAYLNMPLQLEVGAMYQGDESPMQYYGALYGTVDLTPDDRIALSLRSNTIAKGQTNNNSVVLFDYSGKDLQVSAGNIQTAGEFMVDGYGARGAYSWKANKVELFTMLKSRTGDTKVAGIASQLALNERIRLYDGLSLAKDNVTDLSSGIFSQISEYQFEKGKLALITGIGAEKNEGKLTEGTQNTLVGTSLGYNFQWKGRKLAILSNVLFNSNNYPGTFKGQRTQNHDVRWLLKKNYLGGYYESNVRRQNYWSDTVLYQDVLNTNSANYGVKAGFNLRGTSLMAAVGRQHQNIATEGAPATRFNYVNLNVSSVLFKNLFVSLSSFAGEMSTSTTPKRAAFVSTTQATLQRKGVGASIRYDNGPYYYNEFIAYLRKPEQYERIIVSPYAEMQLFKKSLSARVQANYARTLPSDVTTANFLANINYFGKRYDININGIVPVAGPEDGQSAYINAAVRMRLNAPFLPVRRYHNLKLILFKDENSNGVKDAGEEPISGQTLSLNGDLFVSDGDGVVIYKNTAKGIYKADFGYTSKLKGWIPNDGSKQQFELNSNKTIQVPYKVSRVLSGELLVEKDSLSNAIFNPANIKVTATGAKGEVYVTLTDENGQFYFNLPAGDYVVTLNENAFNDKFRPLQFSQTADLKNNKTKTVYFEIKQKRRQINIHKR